jgi:hypothetical protein
MNAFSETPFHIQALILYNRALNPWFSANLRHSCQIDKFMLKAKSSIKTSGVKFTEDNRSRLQRSSLQDKKRAILPNFCSKFVIS